MRKRIVALCLILVTLTVCCGCGGETVPPSQDAALVIIAGRHANASFPSVEMLSQTVLSRHVSATVEYGKKENQEPYGRANVQVILCDGKPDFVDSSQLLDQRGKPLKLYYEGGNMENTKNHFANLGEDMAYALNHASLQADDPGVDLIAALSKAADYLNASGKTNKEIIIIDSGICTEGNTQMQNGFNIQKHGTDTLISALPDDAFVNLTDIHVVFYGLGCVDELDQQLSPKSAKEGLVNFWTEYFKQCHAIVNDDLRITPAVNCTPMRYNVEDPNGYPYVPIVYFEISRTDILTDPTGEPEEPPKELVLSENTLKFEKNSSEFLNNDSSQAIEALKANEKYFQSVLTNNPDAILYVVGSCAMGNPNSTHEQGTLSLERALKVAELMVSELGISEKNIRVIQAGHNKLPWIQGDDFYKDGTRNHTVSQSHRVVVIVPETLTAQMNALKGATAEYTTDLLSNAMTLEEAEREIARRNP